MTTALFQTLCDLDAIPSILESIRLRCQSGQWLLQAEEWVSKATLALEKLSVHYEDGSKDGEAYKEPEEFRRLRLLDKHLELLMKTTNLQKLFRETYVDPEMLELLLSFDRPYLQVDPSAEDNHVICAASIYGHTKVVKRLLEARDDSGRMRVDPSARDNEAIRNASNYGNVGVVKLLLEARDDSGRLWVDPSSHDNYSIRMASQFGHVKVVKLLLEARDDSGRMRVDPSARNNYAIRSASENGNLQVVKALLAARDDLDRPRVDPSDNDEEAIESAYRNRHFEVFELLKEYMI
jgi:hypothetical protein